MKHNFHAFLAIVALCILGLTWAFLHQIDSEWAKEDKVLAEAQTYFMASDSGFCEVSYYSAPEHGRKTAFGERFDSLAFTCAMDFNTPIFYNDRLEISDGVVACTVRVNDRMSTETCRKFPNRDLDLAQAAAARMGMLKAGIKYLKWRKILLDK